MSKKLNVGDTVTDISGAKAKVIGVDPARGKVAIKITESGGPGTPEGKEMVVPDKQVRK